MRRFIIAVSCIMCCFAPSRVFAVGRLQKVHLFIAGREVVTKVSAVADDTETYAPLDVLKAVGAEGRLSPRGETVLVSEQATGRSLELALARLNGTEMVALSDLAHVVDAVVVRGPFHKGSRLPGNTVCFAALITGVQFDGAHAKISTSFPVHFKVQPSDKLDGQQNVIDCEGAVLDGFRLRQGANRITLSNTQPDIVRVTISDIPRGMTVAAVNSRDVPAQQFDAAIAPLPPVVGPMQSRMAAHSDAGRLSGDLPPEPAFEEPQSIVSRIAVAVLPPVRSHAPAIDSLTPRQSINTSPIRPLAPAPSTTAGADTSVASRNQVQPPAVVGNDAVGPDGAVAQQSNTAVVTAPPPTLGAGTQTAPPVPPVEIRSLAFITDNVSRARIELSVSRPVSGPVSGKANVAVHYLPGTTSMEIVVANAVIHLPDQDNGERDVQHPLVNHVAIAVADDQPRNARVQIDTVRIVGYTLAVSADKITLDLRIPRNATGALSDKLIVIDPGHGGSDTGATGHGGQGTVHEKTITLAIAMKLRAALEQCGARVVITRDSDVAVRLYDRSKLANTIGADLFVSIHNDSTPHLNSASGTTTYYHAADSSSRALAACVQEAVHSVTGLPGKGAQSDYNMYATGFAVLRTSTMPAVLCEVAYINNTGDRSKLVNPVFQSRVAQAMCDGLRSYVEGRPRPTVREGQPNIPIQDSVTLHDDDPTH